MPIKNRNASISFILGLRNINFVLVLLILWSGKDVLTCSFRTVWYSSEFIAPSTMASHTGPDVAKQVQILTTTFHRWCNLCWLATPGKGTNGLEFPPFLHNLLGFKPFGNGAASLSRMVSINSSFSKGPQKCPLFIPWHTSTNMYCESQTSIDPCAASHWLKTHIFPF